MSYQCLIVDDEPIATDIIANYLGRLEGFAIAGKFTNPVKAFEFLQTRKIDLLFLDIQMPGLSGLEFLQSLRRRPEVILTTAFREFAGWFRAGRDGLPVETHRFRSLFESHRQVSGKGVQRRSIRSACRARRRPALSVCQGRSQTGQNSAR